MHRYLVVVLLFISTFLKPVIFYSPKLVHILNPIVLKATQSSPAYIAFQLVNKQSLPNEFNDLINQQSTDLSLPIQNIVDLNKGNADYSTQELEGLKLSAYQNTESQIIHLDEMKFSSRLVKFENVNADLNSNSYISTSSTQSPTHQRNEANANVTTASVIQAAQVPVIFGEYQLAGGVAITNDHHVELKRIENGIVKDHGQVDFQDGKYKISVTGFKGELVAQVVHQTGRVDGQTRVSIMPDLLVQITANYFEGPKLNVKKVGTEVVTNSSNDSRKESNLQSKGSQFSYYSGLEEAKKSNQTKIAKANAFASMDNFYIGSSTLLYKKENKESVGTLSFVESNQNEVVIDNYSRKFIEGTVSFINDMYNENVDVNQPILIGKVSGPELVTGLEIFIRNENEVKVFYFDDFFIPQKSENKLYSNGTFIAFLNKEGLVTADLKRQGRLVNYINSVVELGQVTQVRMSNGSDLKDVQINSFDAFSGEAVYSQFEMQALDEVVDVNDSLNLRLSNRNLIGYGFTPDDDKYLSSYHEYKEQNGYINLPRIKKEWMTNLIINNGKILQPQTSIIVGFVQDDSFEAFLPTQLDQNRNPDQFEVLYFDANGVLTESGVAGGGFVIINVRDQVQEVMVQFKNSEVIVNKVTPIQAGHIFTHRFSLK